MNPDNERKQERLRIRRDRERQARTQETADTETPEARQARLHQMAASTQTSRASETPEARQARLQQMAASTQTSTASDTPEARQACLQQMAASTQTSRASETPEARQARSPHDTLCHPSTVISQCTMAPWTLPTLTQRHPFTLCQDQPVAVRDTLGSKSEDYGYSRMTVSCTVEQISADQPARMALLLTCTIQVPGHHQTLYHGPYNC
ncbi:uncharacterized protein LOC135335606 isoform X2 [Halichondria panicea]|uniref:uncharacterized protein LOC135335606 isoform X2 n=1 Tax=Halichondria panicea TaxID=6063 RepID=UPI00312B658C